MTTLSHHISGDKHRASLTRVKPTCQTPLHLTVELISSVLHRNAPEHIFPDAAQKDVELSPEASREDYERGSVDLCPPVRTCHSVTVCKQH